MASKLNDIRNLEDILRATSDVLFPEELGTKSIGVDSKDSNGDTPLHVTIWQKDIFAVELLIHSGADVNAIGDMGETPLHVAISQRDDRIIEMLLMADSRTDISSEFHETALEKAEKIGGSIEELIKRYTKVHKDSL